jgi:hypothetical protein
MLTDRDIQILTLLVRYYLLSRDQIQRLCFSSIASSRSAARKTRERIQQLLALGLIQRHNFEFYNPAAGRPAPLYYPTRKGCEFLAEHLGDERYLATTIHTPIAQHALHWIALAETHITLDTAIARQQIVQLDGWINEFDIVNKQESAPEKRFRLYTLLRESQRLVCAPDAAFMLSVAGHRKVFYVEQDRGTSGVRHVAASKTSGYAHMAQARLHRRHFPETTFETFTVLVVTPNPRRRDALRHAIKSMPGADFWRFVSTTDLKPETFLDAPIIYPCDGEPKPLVHVRNDQPSTTNSSTEERP